MILNKKTIRNNTIAFVVLSILFGIVWLPGVGLAALLLGAINLLAGFLSLAIKRKENGLTLLLCSGVLLLIGFSICSTIVVDFH